MRRRGVLTRAVPALLLVLLAACAGGKGAAPEGPAASGGEADFARVFLARGGDTFVVDPARGLMWLGIVSHEVPFDRAESYCGRLPPRPGGTAWRLPTVDELASAPFDRYRLPDPPVRLWSATAPTADAARRWVVDPYTRTREVQEIRAAVHLRVLCVTVAPPGVP